MKPEQIAANLKAVRRTIDAAAAAADRPSDAIQLVAVSKTKPASMIEAAALAGHTAFGENYIQEAVEKIAVLEGLQIEWHFIGHLQSNKARHAVRCFDLIHGVDSLKLAGAINRAAESIGKVQHVLIQVNISGEGTKSGIPPGECRSLAEAIEAMDHVALRGLMTMPPFFDDPESARPYFAQLRRLRDDLIGHGIPETSLRELSMGMSGDFEAAIAEGATMVRIGTAIFGERH